MDDTTGDKNLDEMIDSALEVTAAILLDPPAATRRPRKEFNPGPASTSRKKRRQAGAFVPHSKQVTETTGSRPIPHPKSKRRAARKARRAIGARGVKTNSQRSGRNAVRWDGRAR